MIDKSAWNVKKTEAAVFFDVSPQAIDGWIRRGCPVLETHPSGRISRMNLSDMAAWRFQQATGRDLDPVAERARRDKETADKIAMENELRRSEVVDVAKVQTLWVRLTTEAKTRFLGLPAKLAPMFVGMTREEIRALLETKIHECLSEFADARIGHAPSDAPAAAVDSQPVGGPAPEAEPGVQRGTGAVGH